MLELIIVISILTMIMTSGASAFSNLLDKQRLKFAAESLFSSLRLAQSEAIKRNQKIYVSFKKENKKWCYGINIGQECDCNKVNNCQIDNINKVTTNAQFKNIVLQKARFAGNTSYTAFDPIKGFAQANGVKNGTIWFKSNSGTQLAVIVNRMGRVRFCSPTLPEYSNQCPKLP